MRAFMHTVIVGGLLLLASIAILVWPENIRKARADAVHVAGDSICVGLAHAINAPSVARVGAHARDVPAQLRRIPKGAKVIACIGTNDAAARLAGFYAAVGAVLATAKERRQRLIWIGPMPTHLWWDGQSDSADTFLAIAVPHYVSLRAIGWSRRDLVRDGIHLTRSGYRRLAEVIEWRR